MELRVEIKKQTKQVRRETIDPGERHFVMTHYTRYLLLNKKKALQSLNGGQLVFENILTPTKTIE